ncbi:Protein TIFY 8 [Bienertia sinuspersici]
MARETLNLLLLTLTHNNLLFSITFLGVKLPPFLSSILQSASASVGSKRSQSDSAFTGSSREPNPPVIPESSHVMKMLRSASGGDRLRFSPFDGPIHGIPHQIRPVSSFLSQATIGTNANFVNPDRSVPVNVGASNMQYNAGVMKSSPFPYQVSSSRLRDNTSGPSVLSSQLAADEGSRTGNKGSGVLNSINAGSNPISERNPSGLVPSGSNLKPPTCASEPEPYNPPSSHGLITSGSGSSQMTVIYGGQVHVFDDVHPNKADVIMSLAGSNGGSWSTNLPRTSARTITNDICLASGENGTSTRFPAQKYHDMLSAGANSIHGLGFTNQGGNIAKAAATSVQTTNSQLEAKREFRYFDEAMSYSSEQCTCFRAKLRELYLESCFTATQSYSIRLFPT